MSTLIQSYPYQKQADEIIEVLFDNRAYLNATKVAAAFGTRPREWYSSQRSIEYMIAIAKRYKLVFPEIEESDFKNTLKIVCKKTGFDPNVHNKSVGGNAPTEQNQLIIIVQGAPQLREQGTWLHPKLAIEFARWLSAEFAIWCDEQIEMILKGHQLLSPESLNTLLITQIHSLKQDLLLEINKSRHLLLAEIDKKLEEKLEQKQKILIFEYLSALYEQGAITQNQLLKLKEKLNLSLSISSSHLVALDCPSREQLKLEAQLLKETGYSWQNIAAKFNERDIPTLSRRGCWTASSVQYLVKK